MFHFTFDLDQLEEERSLSVYLFCCLISLCLLVAHGGGGGVICTRAQDRKGDPETKAGAPDSSWKLAFSHLTLTHCPSGMLCAQGGNLPAAVPRGLVDQLVGV